MVRRSRQDLNLKKEAEKFLADVPEQFIFWCHDGRTFKNLKELVEGLLTMTDDTYTYHSNAEKSDFSTWVRDIIGDKKLAEELAKAQSRTQAENAVAQRVASHTLKLTR